MGLFSFIPFIGKQMDNIYNIVDQKVEDKDLKNQILANMDQMAKQVYIAELGTKTVPWMDGVHKLGRQILNLVTICAVVGLLLAGKTVTPEVALILGGPNAIYQFVKGRGK